MAIARFKVVPISVDAKRIIEEKFNIVNTTFCNIKYAPIQIIRAIIRFGLNMIIPSFALTLNVAISHYHVID